MTEVEPAREAEAAAPPSERLPIVGIGASAGGLEALRDMLGAARVPTGMAFVVVQHLDPNHESMLAQLLDRQTALDVLQCEGGETLRADRVYIIPPGHGLAIREGRLELTEFAQPRGLRRPIDDFFLSLASDQQANAACVILSGTGADGTTGLRAIKENGGVCVVQQPDTARYDGMPLSAVGTGLVDFIRPSTDIIPCLTTFFARRGSNDPLQATDLVSDYVEDLCQVLRTTVGHDFTGYKRSTLVRRIERRMHVLGIATGHAYLQRIRRDAEECGALFRDLLINVTRFFRDAEHFETLRRKVIEPLIRERDSEEDLRVWIPGCSSGEEAYSIAILFAEAARLLDQPLAVQIFATDIDEQMLQIARQGSYPAAALLDIPANLRERYAVPHGERFTIVTPVRDLIRFSSHSLVKDPPFSRIDLISCRNLLIYFDDRLQQSIMPLLHYAVRPGGFLFLGPSESVGRFEHLFPVQDQHARLFTRSPGAPSYPIGLRSSQRERPVLRERTGRSSGQSSLADESAAVRRIVDRYAPASMVLDQDGSILAAYGRLGRYFDFPVTRAGGSSAITLARPGLRRVLGPLLRRGRDERRRLVAREVEVETDFGVQPVEVVCDPLGDGTFLLIFRDAGTFRPAKDADLGDLPPGEDHIEALEDELRLTRHRLRSTVEELETANEELKSSNEEMMSMNEELQSTNEELATVNDELKSKVDQLTTANSDLRNFFESTELAVVVVDSALRIRSYTDAATSIFPLQPADRGRPLGDVASRLKETSYLEDAQRVVQGGPPVQRRVVSRDGARTFSLRILAYRNQNGSADGASLVLTEITEALSLERELAAERERLDIAIKAGGIGIWEYWPDTGATSLDAVERTLFDLPQAGEVTIGEMLDRIIAEDRPAVAEALRRAAEEGGDFEASFRLRPERDGQRWVKSFGRSVDDRMPRRLVGVSIDVTAEYAVAETRELMLREMNHRVKNLFAIIGGMVSAAARSHDDVPTFASDIRERIVALGRAHSLASASGEQSMIALSALIDTTLAPYRDHARITIEGPPVLIGRASLSPLALMLHEWATNSVKYGALGDAEGGSLAMRWWLEEEGLVIDWREEGGRASKETSKTGFGTLLVRTSSRQLGAQVRGTADGNRYMIELVLPKEVLADV